MDSFKDDDKQLRQCHRFNILPRQSKIALAKTRGLSFESANVEKKHLGDRLSRSCLCERMNDHKSDYRQRSYSMISRKERPKKKSKVVRFADSLGLECAVTVREFDSNDLPEVPAYLLSSVEGSKNGASALEETVTLTFKYNFSARDQCSLEESVRAHKVALFKIHISEDLLSGLVLVADLSADKTLSVRWTHDLWTSFTDSYSYFCSKYNHSLDQFSFQIILPPSVMILGGSIEFALCFKSQGREFWDNNSGDNYRLVRTLCPFSQ